LKSSIPNTNTVALLNSNILALPKVLGCTAMRDVNCSVVRSSIWQKLERMQWMHLTAVLFEKKDVTYLTEYSRVRQKGYIRC